MDEMRMEWMGKVRARWRWVAGTEGILSGRKTREIVGSWSFLGFRRESR